VFDIGATSAMPNLSAVILFCHSFLFCSENSRRGKHIGFVFVFSSFPYATDSLKVLFIEKKWEKKWRARTFL
jgi:hypothetical protein